MKRFLYFITHPNVVISADVPVPEWRLSEVGRRRMQQSLRQPWMKEITAIYCSTEQKAIDGAVILSEHLAVGFTPVHALGENDRSSTGFLAPLEFESVANKFFAEPSVSVLGWERAADAQARISLAVEGLASQDQTSGAIAVVSHGAVGTLLYCALAGKEINRCYDQPPNGGGNYFRFSLFPREVSSWWLPADQSAA